LNTSLVALVIVLVVWNIPGLDRVLYPFRLFVTFIHEAGHGLAAILTGGEFLYFDVLPDGAGLATTRGGSRAAILPAGYLSAAFFGAALFYVTNRFPYPRLIALAVGAGVGTLSLLYGQTSQIAYTVGGAFALALVLVGLLASRYQVVLLLNLLAIMTALNAVLDLLFLTRNITARAADGRILNDAAAFALEIMPETSPALWAWLWAGASVLLLGIAVYRSLLRPLLNDRLLARRHPHAPPAELLYHDEDPYITEREQDY